MEKDAYYFPHFCNAKSDRKILRVRKELGLEGYAIFFMLLETLREQADLKYPLDDIDLLADEFGTSEQKLRTVIANYQLFEIDEESKFFSPRLLVYLQPYFKTKEARAIAGKKGADKRWHGTAIAEPLHSHSTAIAKDSKVKERKVNKSRVNETYELKGGEVVPINLTTHDLLVNQYDLETVEKYYTKILDYSRTHEKNYKDYSSTARNWINGDIEKGNPPPKKKHTAPTEICPACGGPLGPISCGKCGLDVAYKNDEEQVDFYRQRMANRD